MYIKVKLLAGFPEPLTYKVPDDWQSPELLGAIVQVPIRTKTAAAFVIDQFNELPPDASYKIRAAIAQEELPRDASYLAYLQHLSEYYQVDSFHFIKRIKQFLLQQEVTDAVVPHEENRGTSNHVTLTDEQQTVTDFISPTIINPVYTPVLLHGITGSGKTEVYKSLITTAIAHGKTVILTLPEVTLALQFQTLLKKQLPTVAIHGFHSATSIKDKRITWQNLLQSKPQVVVGVHLPLLLPIPNLGLIIIDEEHEVGYQEKKHPKINSKEAALFKAKAANIPILLGSATPSISSLYNVQNKGWHFFQLKKRFAGALPEIKTVFLSDKKVRRNFWISQQLEDAIKDRLLKKEQIIIFLNRRGYSFFVQCKECSFIFSCSTCSVSLTLHADTTLRCHYCSFSMQQPQACPGCKKTEFIKKGIGTQQVVTILEKLFPFATIGRADMDTSTKKKVWQKTMEDFESGVLNILVGTQTITKGFHFPNVTLVGILWADLNLHFPIFNACETALQQLIQVAGRAGRQKKDALVIVQAMADHSVFQYLNELTYPNFYEQEIATRREVGYPPFKRLVEIELKSTDELRVEKDAHVIAQQLTRLIKQHELDVQLLGPAKPPIYKIKNIFVRKLYLKADTMLELSALYGLVQKKNIKSQLFFTPNPVS